MAAGLLENRVDILAYFLSLDNSKPWLGKLIVSYIDQPKRCSEQVFIDLFK